MRKTKSDEEVVIYLKIKLSIITYKVVKDLLTITKIKQNKF